MVNERKEELETTMHQRPIHRIWQKVITPDLTAPPAVWEDSTFQDVIPQVHRFPLQTNEFSVPDPKSLRSMSRAAVLISSMADEMIPQLKPYLEESPFSVGIYCAVENGPIDGPSTAKIIERSTEAYDFQFAEAYRKFRNPKMYLKQLPNLAPAQLGISLGIQGPMNVYTHSEFACQQALEQAKADLQDGTVRAALIVTANAFEDFWIGKRLRQQETRCLSEGAAACILVLDKEEPSVKKGETEEYLFDAENYFGISDPLINLLRKTQVQ